MTDQCRGLAVSMGVVHFDFLFNAVRIPTKSAGDSERRRQPVRRGESCDRRVGEADPLSHNAAATAVVDQIKKNSAKINRRRRGPKLNDERGS
jgi:hypothetical protein